MGNCVSGFFFCQQNRSQAFCQTLQVSPSNTSERALIPKQRDMHTRIMKISASVSRPSNLAESHFARREYS